MNRKIQLERLKCESGMTLIELIVYMAIASLFMMSAMFILGSGNAFSKEAKEQMHIQNEFRLASISIKNALRRYDYTDGFKLVDIDKTAPNKGKSLSCLKEGEPTVEIQSLYFDKASKQLMEKKIVRSGSNTSAIAREVLKPICKLDEFTISIDKTKKTVTVEMSYGALKQNYRYKEVFNYKCEQFPNETN